MAVNDLRRVSWRLALLTLLPLCVLAWLSVRMLAGERDAERQRHADRARLVADRVALEIQRSLQEIEDTRATVRLTADGLVALDGGPLLYGAPATGAQWWDESPLDEAQRLEFQAGAPDAAARLYRAAATDGDSRTRAHALAALARIMRHQRAYAEALGAYDELERLGETLVAGDPAALLAHRARLRLHEETRDAARLRAAAHAFATALYAGRWRIDRAAFEEACHAIQEAGVPPPPATPLARTRAAVTLWQEWRQGQLPGRGRRLIDDPHVPLLAVWSERAKEPAVWLGSLDDLQATWLPIASREGASLSVSTIEGRHIFGPPTSAGVAVMPAETRVPLVFHVTLANDPGDPASRSRQRVLVSVLGGAFLLLVAVAWSISQTTHRELTLARQQTDFVSAVSHEFRTPLTSMRHLLDLLSTRPVPEDRRAHYYGLLTHETERLHRMVDTLLTFGRLEAGAHGWRMQTVDLRDLLGTLVETFAREPMARGRAVSCDVDDDAAHVAADAEAVSRALWNLVENAAKYSPAGSPIAITATREREYVRITVADQGMGIDASDRERIFGKFQRGSLATHCGVRGVGIGLALVRLIAEGHGGSVSVESAPGQGSRFTLALPVSREEAR